MTDATLIAAISDAMLSLEDRREDPEQDVPVGVAAARIAGLEHSAEWDDFLIRESYRVLSLIDGHYTRMGIKPTRFSVAALGIVQGLTLGMAIQKVREMS